jgi:F-box-like
MQVKSRLPEKCDDILSHLPAEMLLHVTSFLDVLSLTRAMTVNKRLHKLCANDEAGWITLCQQLWNDKTCVPPEFFHNPCMNSYRRSLEDAKTRHHIRPNELVYVPETETGPIWSFRFKEAAGPEWTAWDPWWNGRAARKMVFLPDGSVRQYLLKGKT